MSLSYDDFFERRVAEAAERAGITYLTGRYLCFWCQHTGKLDDGKHLPAGCEHCGSSFMIKGSCTVPDGIIMYGAICGLVYVDGGVHGRYKVMLDDDRIRQRLFGDKQGLARRIFAFVIKNVEIGKPKKITKQKHTEFMPTQITVGNLVNINLSSIILGWVELMRNGELYERIMGQEREIIGLGQNAGIKRVR